MTDGSLIIKDKSGRTSDDGVTNDLELNFYGDIAKSKNASSYLKFEDKKMTDEGTGSMKFMGVNYPGKKYNDNRPSDVSQKTGADFVTYEGAPINDETFMKNETEGSGWTIEIIYMLNEDFDPTDNRMGIVDRMSNKYMDASGKAVSLPTWTSQAGQKGPLQISITNCKEPQINYLPYNGNKTTITDTDMNPNDVDTNLYCMQDSSWGLSLDNGGKWYNLVVNCDNDTLKSFLNDGDSFRNRKGKFQSGNNQPALDNALNGMYTNLEDKRWRIGSSWENSKETGNTYSLWKLLQGNIERIRVSKKVLEKNEQIVPDSSKYMDGMGRNGDFELRGTDTYAMGFFPDTQNSIKFTPAVAKAATKYMVDNKDTMFKNLIGISHVGDVVENGTGEISVAQWQNAQDAYWQLADNFNYLSLRGNHDGGINTYKKYFGPQATYTGKDYTADNSEKSYADSSYGDLVNDKVVFSETQDGSYMIVEGGSYKYLIIALGMESEKVNGTPELTFLDEVLTKYPDYPAIVTSHNIFGCSAAAPDQIEMNGTGNAIWNVAKKHDNVFMMVAGHNHGTGYLQGDKRLFNDYGNEVIGMLVDLQFGYNGGNAWYRFVEFDENNNKLYFNTFSPYAASLPEDNKLSMFNVSYYEGIGLNWDIDFNFAERFAFASETSPADKQIMGGAEVGKAFSQTITPYGGLSIELINGTLPKGLTFNAEMGVLSGTPEESGVFNLKFEIKNSHGSAMIDYLLFVIKQGEQGEQGLPGDKGEQGEQGAPGNKGDKGDPANAEDNGCGAAVTGGSVEDYLFLSASCLLLIRKKKKEQH